MDWGIPTLIEAPGAEESAALCRELGFDFVELNMNLPEYQRLDVPALKSVAERYGIYYTIHFDENGDMCYFNPRVADAYLETMLETLRAAHDIGIPVINMHLAQGVYFTLPDRKVYLYELYREPFFRRLNEVIKRFEDAADNETTICIENTGSFNVPFLQDALEKFLTSKLFGLTFDIGHDHSAGNADKPFILSHQDRLRHFHIHDAFGRKNHLPLGAGEMDIPWYVDLAERLHCRAVLEVKTAQALRDSAGWLKSRGLIHK